jgi:ferritin
MLGANVQEAINDQINYELFSSYQYLAMAAWCEHEQFVGCAKWLRIQSEEEYGHAMRLYNFLLARNYLVKLKPIAAPEHNFKSVADIFEKALEQELKVSGQIDALYELALVHHRASRGREDRPRGRPQVQNGRRRSGVALGPGSRARRKVGGAGDGGVRFMI